ncbi:MULTISPECIES: MFS transporter [Streptomyces]|uniref:Multidrug efflux pump Tap n=1 Tax=Streptomyces harbinensis TaxID=1176198 RepID=A0A1I6RHR4_9ACTN|nr:MULTISPECIES: MFS transporter [Streptomyces]SFS64281.1 Predicted arabinose efflux permease, MFS family [Streptomyces harbinensis]
MTAGAPTADPGADADERRTLRPLAGLLGAVAVSQTGTKISTIALPWFVLTTTGSAVQTGLVALFEMAPYVLLKGLSGPVIDRIGPRRVSWTMDLVSAVPALLIPLLHAAGALSLPVLLALVAVIGAARGPGDLAKQVMVPEAAERCRVPLERATGLSGTTERLSATIGPGAAGLLVALIGSMSALFVIAGCFAAGSLIIAATLPRAMGRPHRDPDGAGDDDLGYWARLGQGFGVVRGDPLLLSIALMIAVTNLLDAAFMQVMLPVWVKGAGHGPEVMGLLGTANGITAVAGSLVAAAIAHRMPRRTVFFVGFLIAGAPRFLVLAAGAPLWAVVAVFAFGGLGGGFLNPIISAIIVERAPRSHLARVQGLVSSLAWSGIPFGGLLAGAAIGGIGLVPALVTGGILYAVTTSLTGLRPEWRGMDRARRAARAAATGQPPPDAPTDGPADHPRAASPR